MMRPHLPAAWLALLALALTATGAPLPFSRKQRDLALKALQGEWVVVRYAGRGVSVGSDGSTTPLMKVSVTGTRFCVNHEGGVLRAWEIALPSSAPGGRLDLKPTGRGGDSTKGYRGIYRLGGGRLFLALGPADSGHARPFSFEARGDHEEILVLRRKAH